MDDVLDAARIRAGSLGITSSSRILSTLDWRLPNGIMDGLLAVLAAGASLVHVSNPDPAKLDAHRAAEHTTLDLASSKPLPATTPHSKALSLPRVPWGVSPANSIG